MKFIFICLFIFVVPLSMQAAVIINEVAWKGNNGETSDEWIELYNNGSEPVDVAGWALRRTRIDETNFDLEIIIGSDPKNPPGSFVIGAGEYVVLEKTDNDSSPAEAFFVYAGTFSLLDGGQSLSLVSHSGVMDVLYGGENWGSVAGDMDVGKTAQYTIGGWVTAEATPGAPNSITTPGASDEDTEDAQQENASISTLSSASVTSTPSVSQTSSSGSSGSTPAVLGATYESLPLSLTIISPDRAYVRQEISLNAVGSGMSKVIINSLVHNWNFGDLTTAPGKEVTHRFAYPGEYVIVAHSQYKDYEAYARKTITVLPVSFSITIHASGDVQVHNDARYEVDISGYKIVAGGTVTFPSRTILLPNATITIPKEKVQYSGNTTVALFDDTVTLVASVSPSSQSQSSVATVVQVARQQVPALTPVAHNPISSAKETEAPPGIFSFVGEVKGELEPVVTQPTAPLKIGTSQMAAPIEATDTIPDGKMPYFALLAVIGLGVTAVFAGKVTNKP